jgi:hypothetical protein
MVHYQDIVAKPYQSRTVTLSADTTLTLDSPQVSLIDVTASARSITPPQTKVPGLQYKFVRQGTGTNVATIVGTIDGLSNLKLYGWKQWVILTTTTTIGTFTVVSFGECKVPNNHPNLATLAANQPSGILIVEYTP